MISKKQKLTLVENLLKVSGDKTFYTIQGEGQSIGKSAVFLRLHFCNLKCKWCDTKYTWDKSLKNYWSESEDWDIEKAFKEISKFKSKRLVITGGEPLLQQKLIIKLLTKLDSWEVEIETNGTIIPDDFLCKKCQFNVSPKLENSGNLKNLRYNPKALKVFNSLLKTTFKFVVTNLNDVEEIKTIIKECRLDKEKIIIMPEGKTQQEIRKHGLMVVDEVKKNGWRLLPRLQIMLWGMKRRL